MSSLVKVFLLTIAMNAAIREWREELDPRLAWSAASLVVVAYNSLHKPLSTEERRSL